MAKLTKLINYAYLKEEVDLPQDLPDSEFEHKILWAQDTLKMIIGSEFYADYLLKFESDSISFYSALVPFVKQFLAWQTAEYWVPTANYKVTKSGFRIHTETNSAVVSDQQQATITKMYNQQAQKYKMFLVNYLNDNQDSYPLYEQDCNTSNTGGTFKITSVRGKHKEGCGCRRCRC